MAFHFKIFRIVLAFSAAGVLFLSSCITYDEGPGRYNLKLETQLLYVGFDTMSVGMSQSNMLNAKDVRLEYQSLTNSKNNSYQPWQLTFVDPNDASNTVIVNIADFFPQSNSGIVVTPSLEGKINNQPGDPKLDVNTDYQISAFTNAYLQVPENGKCRLLFRRLKVTHSLILPSTPPYYMDIMLEFPKPQ